MALSDTLHDIMYAFFKDPGAYTTKFHNGTGAPSGGVNARKGDYYLNNSTGDLYYYDGTTWTIKTNLNTATGLTDHGLMAGLADDDHPQYLNNARGDARYDARYYQQAQVDSALALKAPLASPALTGSPTVPTPAAGNESTLIANTAWAADRARVGNLLTANQASVETDTTGLEAHYNASWSS